MLISSPGKNDRFDGVCQFIDVENAHALQFGNSIQVVIICDDGGAHLPAQIDQLFVDLLRLCRVLIEKLDFDIRDLLQAVQDFEPSPAAISRRTSAESAMY